MTASIIHQNDVRDNCLKLRYESHYNQTSMVDRQNEDVPRLVAGQNQSLICSDGSDLDFSEPSQAEMHRAEPS